MRTKTKVYLFIILILSGFLLYQYSITPEFEDLTPKTEKNENIDYEAILGVQPKILPKPIPKEVLKSARENDFYYFLFLGKARKNIVYTFKKGSTSLKDSEVFHTKISEYLEKELYDGMYKNQYFPADRIEPYEKNLLKDFLKEDSNSNKIVKNIAEKQKRLEVLKTFIDDCYKTMCVINNKTNEYLLLDTRDFEKAKELLLDYKLW